jgi:TPR repeat protein
VDFNEALKWYHKAAEQDFAISQHNLGMLYGHGFGVAADLNEAAKWFRKAAEQGLVEAKYTLGVGYERGFGVAVNLGEAIRWYRLAAEQGYAPAQNDLGSSYVNGNGVAKDMNEAVRWYRKAAEQGYALAQFNLGASYANGTGIDKDENEAVRWFRLAAEQGHALAQFGLARAYHSGRGVPQNDREAERWLRKSAEQGLSEAQEILDSMQPLSRGDRVEKFGEGLGRMTVTGYPIAMILAFGFCKIRRWFTGKHYPFWRAVGYCIMGYFVFCIVNVILLSVFVFPALNPNPNPEPLLFQILMFATPLFYGIGLGACVLMFLDVDWKNISHGQKFITLLAFFASSLAVMFFTVVVVGILFTAFLPS